MIIPRKWAFVAYQEIYSRKLEIPLAEGLPTSLGPAFFMLGSITPIPLEIISVFSS